jgi:hypothetical protein
VQTRGDPAVEAEQAENELAALVGPFWTEAKVREALNVSPERLASARAEGSVLALPSTDGDRFYPVSQFRRHDHTAEVKPGLASTLRVLREFDPWTVAVLLHTPADELDGHTPFNWLSGGHPPEALASLARQVARDCAVAQPDAARTAGSATRVARPSTHAGRATRSAG